MCRGRYMYRYWYMCWYSTGLPAIAPKSAGDAGAIPVGPLLEVGEALPGGVHIVHYDDLVASVTGIIEIPPLIHCVFNIGRWVGPARRKE